MIRRAALTLALFTSAHHVAAEGGPIRSGEHIGFSRLVMEIEPTTEWSLERGDGDVTIFFPRKAIEFATADIFRLIPRTRIEAVESRIDPAGTTVSVALGCDCRVSTVFVGARYLALDIGDRGEVQAPLEGAAAPGELLPPTGPRPAAEEPAEARAAREVAAVTSAEEILLRQIERAAEQGLIKLADQTEAPHATTAGPAPDPVMPPALPPAPAGHTPPPVLPLAIGVEAVEPPPVLADLLDHDQVRATTVFDRDRAAALGNMAAEPPPPECLVDAAFALADWADGRPPFEQIAEKSALLLKEFDTPDPEVLEAMARIYIRFGLGLEAERLLAAFPVPLQSRPLLVDLARVMEGRAPGSGGPLALASVCDGAHGLWLGLAGKIPYYGDASHFATVSQAFAELPPDLRALVGPRLVGGLLDERQTDAARTIYDLMVRSEPPRSAELELAEARLVAAEGNAAIAIRALSALVEANASNAIDALGHLGRLSVDSGVPLPDRLIADLEAAALQQRGTPRGPEFRALLAEAQARRGDIAAAIANLRVGRAEWPADSRFSVLAVALLGAADPSEIGPAAYAETILGSLDLLPLTADTEDSRRAIARHLLSFGLAAAARDLVADQVERGDERARLLAAEAALALGEEDDARMMLLEVDGADAATLRARALARDGSFDGAVATLVDAGLDRDAAALAWPSGDWERAAAAEADDPARQAMARYMQARTGSDAPRSGDVTDGEGPGAFATLPELDPPSLEAARRLLTTGREVEEFVADLLNDR